MSRKTRGTASSIQAAPEDRYSRKTVHLSIVEATSPRLPWCRGGLSPVGRVSTPRTRTTASMLETAANSPSAQETPPRTPPPRVGCAQSRTAFRETRSEEHTSELQSLMRISYADFRLK